MARMTWILFGLSIASMLVGIGLVLVFLHTLVVPSIDRYRHVWDQCLVLNISKLREFDKFNNMKDSGVGQVTPEQEGLWDKISTMDGLGFTKKEQHDDPESILATIINITYASTEEHRSDRELETNYVDDYSGCFMVHVRYGVWASDVVKPQIFQETKPGILLQDINKSHEDDKHAKSKCFCYRCHAQVDELTNSTSLVYDNGVFRMGDILQCSPEPSRDKFTAPEQSHSIKYPQRDWILFNAMFWSTLTFVIGFVALFFTSIFLTKDDWKWNCDHHEASIEVQDNN